MESHSKSKYLWVRIWRENSLHQKGIFVMVWPCFRQGSNSDRDVWCKKVRGRRHIRLFSPMGTVFCVRKGINQTVPKYCTTLWHVQCWFLERTLWSKTSLRHLQSSFIFVCVYKNKICFETVFTRTCLQHSVSVHIYMAAYRVPPPLYRWPGQLHTLLPWDHPWLDGGHQHTSQQDLNWVVNEQGHGY